ncbi:MAG: helix-turn-helix domain-containing protein [Alphaproteobacteria bacterium]|nr:helix-turn-helix domain-containing protein [Alphaproteobacteria bacterium]
MSNRSSPPKSDKEQKPVEGQGGASGKKQDYHTNMPVGEILRRAREHYGQSLPDVESAIRIRASQIDAIEKSQYDRLPGRVYAIGFVRSYSEYLGFDGDKMVSLFKSQSVGGGRIKPELNFPAPASESRLPPVWLVVIGGILFAGFMVFWASQNVIDHDTIAAVPTVPALKAEAETAPEAPLDISEQAVPEEDAEQVASDTAVPDAVEEIPVGEDVVSAPEDSEAAAPVSKSPESLKWCRKLRR